MKRGKNELIVNKPERYTAGPRLVQAGAGDPSLLSPSHEQIVQTIVQPS